MDKRTFYRLGIGLGVVTFLLDFFVLPIESIVVGAISLVLNLKKRKENRILIGMVFTILGLIGAISFLAWLIYTEVAGLGESSYWFCRLLFG